MVAKQRRSGSLSLLIATSLSTTYPANSFPFLTPPFAPATLALVARSRGFAPVFRSLSAGSDDNDHKGEEDEESSPANRDVDSDPAFLDDLKRAAASKLGADLPAEAVAEAASSAESEFLAAMKDVRAEFEDAKAELGSDGAVEMFIRRINEEDDRARSGGGRGGRGEDGDEEDIGEWQ